MVPDCAAHVPILALTISGSISSNAETSVNTTMACTAVAGSVCPFSSGAASTAADGPSRSAADGTTRIPNSPRGGVAWISDPGDGVGPLDMCSTAGFASCTVCVAAGAAGDACGLAGEHTWCGAGGTSVSSLSLCTRTVTCNLSRTSRVLASASRRRRLFCTSDVSGCWASTISTSVTCASGSPKVHAGPGHTPAGGVGAAGGFANACGVGRPIRFKKSASGISGSAFTFGVRCSSAASARSKLSCMFTFARPDWKASPPSPVAKGCVVGLLGGIPGGFRWSPLKEVPSHGPLSKYWVFGDVGGSTLS